MYKYKICVCVRVWVYCLSTHKCIKTYVCINKFTHPLVGVNALKNAHMHI